MTVQPPGLLPRLVAMLLTSSLIGVAHADLTEDPWALCHDHDTPLSAESDGALSAQESPTHILSDYAEMLGSRLLKLHGDVLIRRGAQTLRADSVLYDDLSARLSASGAVSYTQGGFLIDGDSADMNLDSEIGALTQARYRYLPRHAHGNARLLLRDGPALTRLAYASYTTCDRGDLDWELRARRVNLNHDTAVGSAWHVTLRFQDVPFFYFPYVNFPLNDERKTGLLVPSIGHSDETGLDFGAPFYWNIAPNYDATITPRVIERRGLMAMGEFRYLTARSGGTLNLEFLPDDSVYGDDRGLFAYRHGAHLAPRWRLDVDANYVSDERYLAELGGSLSAASTTHMERRADVRYDGEYATLLTRVQGFQTVDRDLPSAARPYQRLPQLLFNGLAPTHPLGTDWQLDGEWVRFERDGSVTGARLDLEPAIALPISSAGYFFTPRIALRYTQYQLDNQAVGAPNSPERSVPLYSLDSGLYLERDTQLGGQDYVHTLEPRLFYLRVPRRDQDALPVFDTSAFDFSYAQLFRDNRYTSADRQGDTDQLSAAVTTRLLDRRGAERLRAALGQIFYFRDREVTLPGEMTDTRNYSDMVGEISLRPGGAWTTTATLQWNPAADRIERGGMQFHWQPHARQIFNAGYRYRRDQLEQADLSVLWPLTPHWHVVGRWNYSLRERRPLETLAGVQYESCCWALRLSTRRYVNDAAGDSNQSFYLQLELKGLANIGNSVEDALERGILGYRGR